MEVSHGKEEKRQESGKEKEKEESSKKESQEEIAEEAGKGQGEASPKKGEAEKKNGQEGCQQTGSSDGGIDGHGAFDGGNARRGENRPEPRSRVALSDGFQALAGLRMTAVSPGAFAPRAEPRAFDHRRE
jgi:hypothetical protein